MFVVVVDGVVYLKGDGRDAHFVYFLFHEMKLSY